MLGEFSLGIVSIATNGYIKYWESMVDSANKNLIDKSRVTFHLFTDDYEQANIFSKRYIDFSFKFYTIESLKWPEATLHRYRIYSEFSNHFAESHLMHLDSDMLIIGDFLEHVFSNPQDLSMRLVKHPGFFRPNGLRRLTYYFKVPRQLVGDLRMYLVQGGLGAWENRVESTAYVPREKRESYFCGGVWFGARASFISLVKELEITERKDSESGVMAVWHDESHLNNWATKNRHVSYPPSLCFDERYRNLDGLKNIITAVDKGNPQK